MRSSPIARICACSVALLAAGGPPAAAADAAGETPRGAFFPSHVFLQVARGSDTDAQAAGLRWAWRTPTHPSPGGSLNGYTEVSIGRWSARNDDGRSRAISTQIGIAPVMRYHFERFPSWFVEGAIGLNLIAPVFRNGDRRFSTVFNFGDQIGAGYRSPGGGWEWSLRVEHFSNAGIREPNPGQNFIQLRWTLSL